MKYLKEEGHYIIAVYTLKDKQRVMRKRQQHSFTSKSLTLPDSNCQDNHIHTLLDPIVSCVPRPLEIKSACLDCHGRCKRE